MGVSLNCLVIREECNEACMIGTSFDDTFGHILCGKCVNVPGW